MTFLSFGRLRAAAASGTSIVAASVIASNILRIGSSMTLTRLLDSHAYGVVGIITSIAFTLNMLSDVGMLEFIVRHKEGDDRRFLNQVWTIRLVRGLCLCLVMAAGAKPIAMLLDKPELAPVIAIWSVIFAIDGVASLAFATAPRNKMLWRISLLDFSANVASLIVSVIAALIWRSYWALIAGMVSAAVFKTILSYLLFPESGRRWHLDRARFAELWGFSRYIAMSSALTLFLLQADKVVLARVMPLSVFGFYAIAAVLAAAPGGLVSPYTDRVLLPAYSAAMRDDPANLARVFYAYRRKILILFMAAVGAMLGGARLLIALLYDPRYAGVAPYLQLLAISAGLRMMNYSAKVGLIALGRTRTTLFANICGAVWLAIGGAVAIALGNVMLLVAVVGTAEVPSMLAYWWSLRRAGILNLREESYGLIAMAGTAAIGWLVAREALALFPAL